MSARARFAVPILIFAGLLALMQWLAGGRITLLPLMTVAVFLFTTVVMATVRWSGWIFRVRRGSPLYTALLFVLFVRHFVLVFGTEARRVLLARRLSVPRRWGRGAARSLVFAVVAQLVRSAARAEHFFAAQAARGLAE
jgi:hypothetical protein